MKRVIKSNLKIKLLVLSVLMCILAIGLPKNTNAAVASGLKVPSNRKVISSKRINLAPGVVQYDVVTTNKSGGQREQEYYLTIDMKQSSVGVMATYPGMPKSKLTKGKLDILTNQANEVEKATGRDVIAAVNGDIFDWGTRLPHGPLILNGEKLYSGDNTSWWLFCIMKDGSAQFLQKTESLKHVEYGIGANCMFIQNGCILRKNYTDNDTKLQPRTVIGTTKDGNIVIIAADGRSSRSCGRTLLDMAQELKEMGCVQGSNLDGGGSTMFASQYAGSNTLNIRNTPSDGRQRTVASTLLIYKKPDPNNLYRSSVSVSSASFTGTKVTPKVSVKMNGKTLKKGTDYNIKYSSNIKIGTGYVTITPAKGSKWTSSKKVSFKIKFKKVIPLKASVSSSSKIRIRWNQIAGVDKYYIYKSTKSKSGFKLFKVTNNKAKAYNDSKIKKRKYYYYIIKGYDGTCKKYITVSKTMKVKA